MQGKIIVAEDQMINLEILRSYIERLGLLKDTIFCVDGQKALDCFTLVYLTFNLNANCFKYDTDTTLEYKMKAR